MYTTTTATHEQGLAAANAATRAMKRHECCKSQFKFRCFSCGELVNRGDKITKCHASWADSGMTLRYRGADCQNGLTMEQTAFYQPETGSQLWVHIGCNPCFWDRKGGRLVGTWTEWGSKITHEFEEWRSRTNHYDMEEFLEKHGYPQEKWMKDRIIHAVTRFQAIWLGYLYKKALPIALLQKKATEAININPENSLSQGSYPSLQPKWSLYKFGKGVEQYLIGGGEVHGEFLFDQHKKKAAIYSFQVTGVGRLGGFDGVISVKFHYDGEVRHYRPWRFMHLKKECKDFKKKMGIEATIIGRLPTYYIPPSTVMVIIDKWNQK
jgi:hypothetical protein